MNKVLIFAGGRYDGHILTEELLKKNLELL